MASPTCRVLGANGEPAPIRIYTPEGAGPKPVILYIHGGDRVTADLDIYGATPRAKAGLPVAAQQYDDVTHEFFGMSAAVDKPKHAQPFAAGRLREAFGMPAKDAAAPAPATAPQE